MFVVRLSFASRLSIRSLLFCGLTVLDFSVSAFSAVASLPESCDFAARRRCGQPRSRLLSHTRALTSTHAHTRTLTCSLSNSSTITSTSTDTSTNEHTHTNSINFIGCVVRPSSAISAAQKVVFEIGGFIHQKVCCLLCFVVCSVILCAIGVVVCCLRSFGRCCYGATGATVFPVLVSVSFVFLPRCPSLESSLRCCCWVL